MYSVRMQGVSFFFLHIAIIFNSQLVESMDVDRRDADGLKNNISIFLSLCLNRFL